MTLRLPEIHVTPSKLTSHECQAEPALIYNYGVLLTSRHESITYVEYEAEIPLPLEFESMTFLLQRQATDVAILPAPVINQHLGTSR